MGTSMKKKINYFKFIGHLLMIGAFYYIIRLFMSFDVDWSILLRQNVMMFAFLSVLSYIVNIYAMAYLWKNILAFFSQKEIAYRSIYPPYVKSNIAKYLPGGVMTYVSRNVLCKDMGLSQLQIAGSSIVEIGVTLFSNMILILLFARKSLVSVLQKYTLFSHGQILLYLFIIGSVFLLTALSLILCKKIDIGHFIKTYFNITFVKLFLTNSLICIALTIFSSVFFLLAVNSVTPISLDQAFQIAGCNFVAFVIGFIVPGAPGGMGIREAVFTFLLQGVCKVDLLLIFAVLQRLFSVLADILAYVIYLILENAKRKA